MDSWRPVEPTWITPSRTELADLHVLAFREYRDTGSVKAEAMGATAAWIRGGRNAPVTFREEQPVTKALAKVEMWAAVDVDTGDVPLASLCRDLGVSYAPAVATNPVWSLGVEEVLRWLTADPLERRKPPLPLPRRNPDGSVATAEAKVVIELSRPVASVAREFGLNEQTLRNWVNTYRKAHAGEEPPLSISERARLRELEKEVRELPSSRSCRRVANPAGALFQ